MGTEINSEHRQGARQFLEMCENPTAPSFGPVVKEVIGVKFNRLRLGGDKARGSKREKETKRGGKRGNPATLVEASTGL